LASSQSPEADCIVGIGSEKDGMSTPQNSTWKTQLIESEFPGSFVRHRVWQEQGDEAIFAAAWELVELAEETKDGRKPTLQRTTTTLKRP